MRIDFRMDGGLAAFPGLTRPVSIDCDALPPGETARLRALVERADLSATTHRRRAAPTPDARTYTIAVDDGGECRTVTVSEPIANAAMRDLVAALRAHADSRRAGR
jgi:hypothetical protein